MDHRIFPIQEAAATNPADKEMIDALVERYPGKHEARVSEKMWKSDGFPQAMGYHGLLDVDFPWIFPHS